MPALDVDVLKEKVALACRILAMEGLDDMHLGHVSARLSEDGRYLMKPTDLGLGEVVADDIITLDLGGKKIAGERRAHGETPLHSEVYRSRPDVEAIVHVHPPFATALTATEGGLIIVNHDGVPFAHGVGVYASPELIVRPEQGQAIARALGQAQVLLLANHGILTVGANVEQAVFHALSLEKAARAQFLARGLGQLSPMPHDQAVRLEQAFARVGAARCQSIWDFYVRKLKRHEATLA